MPAEHEVYFSIADSTRFRAPTMTLTHHGGVDIEELDKDQIANVPFDALTGLKAFVVANALADIERARSRSSRRWSSSCRKLWELVHDFGMTTLELNPIRMRPGRARPADAGRLRLQVRLRPRRSALGAAGPARPPVRRRLVRLRDRDQPAPHLPGPERRLRHQPAAARSWRPTFGGGANSLVTEMLGDDAIISSDFGGNPPYEKMKEVARICFKHWLKQSNVLFIIGGKSNNTDIFETFRAMADALREHFSEHGPTPLYVVVGRGGPNLVRGMGALRDTVEALGLPYRLFGFDSDDQRGRQLRPGGRPLDEGRRARRRSRSASACASAA